MSHATVTLTGTYQQYDGRPIPGKVYIACTAGVVVDVTGKVVFSGTAKVALDKNGSFSIGLPATDDAGLTPTGFGYTITVVLDTPVQSTLAPVTIELPTTPATVDMVDITPVVSSLLSPTSSFFATAAQGAKADAAEPAASLDADVATKVTDPASGTRAALDETMRERDTAAAYVDFTTKPDGAAPLTMDTGQTVVTAFPVNGNHPTIASGRLVPGGTLGAGSYGDYYQAQIGSDVHRVGCEWTQPAGADDGHGSVALVLWGSVYDGLGNIPSARCHLTLRPGTGSSGFWEYAVYRGDGSAYCAVKNGSFVNPPADGVTRWSSDVTFDLEQGIAFISLPDGQTVTVTNAEISSAMTGAGQTPMTLAQFGGMVAVAEHYASTGANAAKFSGFTALWAEPVLPARFRRAVSPQTLARAIKGLRDNIVPAPTYLRYMPTTLGSHTATTTLTSADGSNLYVVGTFGPTGKILIDVDTYYEFTGTETVFGYLAEITTGTPTSALETMVKGVSGDKKNVHHLFEITGGTPGETKAWTYQHSGLTGGLATAKWGGSGAGLVPPFTMRTTGL